MTDLGELDVVLTWSTRQALDLTAELERLHLETEATAAGIDDVERRLERLGHSILATEETFPALRRPRESPRGRWDELYARAALALEERGVDLQYVTIDELLSVDEVERIERRFHGAFEINVKLDAFDVLGAGIAGLAAALVDYFVVGIPRNTRWNGELQEGSALTKALRKLAVDNDNWVSRYVKSAISYDRVGGLQTPVDGIGGLTHRVQTFGHDPLLGLVLGVRDIMSGSITAVTRTGHVVVADTPVLPVNSPLRALALHLVHLASDLPTTTGLPVPGWTALCAMPVGKIGPGDATVGEVARTMYLRGYDSWHFLTMATAPATAELVARAFWGLRAHYDLEWRDRIDGEQELSAARSLSEHPRFQAMTLLAHGVAAAANVGKIAMYGGNPVALNYTQWLQFGRAFFCWYQTHLTGPTELLMRRASRSLEALDHGWSSLDASAAGFPTLGAATA